MDKHMKTGVRPLIEAVPEVGTILERHGIGCVQCAIGTCMLEDVVQLHALPSQDEAEMMYQIERAIYPERDVPRPQAQVAVEPSPKQEIVYSPPLQRLVDEQRLGSLEELFPIGFGSLANELRNW